MATRKRTTNESKPAAKESVHVAVLEVGERIDLRCPIDFALDRRLLPTLVVNANPKHKCVALERLEMSAEITSETGTPNQSRRALCLVSAEDALRLGALLIQAAGVVMGEAIQSHNQRLRYNRAADD